MTENNNIKVDTGSENADNLSGNELNAESFSNINLDGSSSTGSVVEVNEEKIEMLKADLDEQKEKYLRLVAEFDNFRRRSRKEHYELEQTAGKDIISSLLVVLDDMDRASKQMETSVDVEVIKEGVTLVFNKMRTIMQKKGLRIMETQKEDFNPDIHEAITEIPVEQEEMQGMVIDVIEPGYYLNEKLIRCAKVVIGKTGELKAL